MGRQPKKAAPKKTISQKASPKKSIRKAALTQKSCGKNRAAGAAAVTIAVGEGAKASDRASTLKTRVDSEASVTDFIGALSCAILRNDCSLISALMSDVTGEPAKLWGGNTVGFGSFNYASSRSKCAGDWMLAGFSPRKAGISMQFMCGFKHKRIQDLLQDLGPHTHTVSCLKPKLKKGESIAEIWDWDVLRQIVEFAVEELRSGRCLGSS
jgi:hypothetical protein